MWCVLPFWTLIRGIELNLKEMCFTLYFLYLCDEDRAPMSVFPLPPPPLPFLCGPTCVVDKQSAQRCDSCSAAPEKNTLKSKRTDTFFSFFSFFFGELTSLTLSLIVLLYPFLADQYTTLSLNIRIFWNHLSVFYLTFFIKWILCDVQKKLHELPFV